MYALVLQALVLREEKPLAAARRSSVPGIVVKLRQALLDLLAIGNLLEVGERDLILLFNPMRDLGRIVILEPPIRIGDGHAKVVIGVVCPFRFRVREPGGAIAALRSRCRKKREERQHRHDKEDY